MNRVPKGTYTKEFREQAVRLVVVDGLTQREAASRLSLSVKTLGAWVVCGATIRMRDARQLS
jgi:transposase